METQGVTGDRKGNSMHFKCKLSWHKTVFNNLQLSRNLVVCKNIYLMSMFTFRGVQDNICEITFNCVINHFCLRKSAIKLSSGSQNEDSQLES